MKEQVSECVSERGKEGGREEGSLGGREGGRDIRSEQHEVREARLPVRFDCTL